MTAEKVRENRLRRVAERRGLTLQKSRRRDPQSIGFGTFGVYRTDELMAGDDTGFGLTLDAVEQFLDSGELPSART